MLVYGKQICEVSVVRDNFKTQLVIFVKVKRYLIK